MQDSVEELHNGFFCISDPTAIAEIPHDDFRRPKEDDDLMPSPMQAVSPEPSPDHKFLANSISRADWSIESFSSVSMHYVEVSAVVDLILTSMLNEWINNQIQQ